MYSHSIRSALEPERLRPYTPAFAVREEGVGWWIEDNRRPIAFIHRESFCFDPFEFSPFSSLGRQPLVHPRYDMGTRINMHMALLANVIGNFCLPDDGLDVQWPQQRPDRLALQIGQRYKSGTQACTTLTVDYRPQREAYGYEISVEVREPVPCPSREFCNFYAGHLGDGIPTQKRWQYTVWLGPDGRLWKLPHNPALTFSVRARTGCRKRLAADGFIGFGVEPDFNPSVLLLDANVPLLSDTCDMWHDEHLTVAPPGVEYTQDGAGVARSRIELVNVPQREMERLVSEAETIPISDSEVAQNACPPLLWDQTCDMEEPLDPRQPCAGMVFVPGDDRWVELGQGWPPDYGWRYREGCGSHAEWLEGSGHSGQRCLKLTGLAGRRVAWLPAGHAFHVQPNARYRFQAWVRTTGECKASIWMGNVWRKIYEVSVAAESEPVATGQWRRAQVELTTTDCPYLYFRLCAVGAGAAYFDDLRVGPVNGGSACT